MSAPAFVPIAGAGADNNRGEAGPSKAVPKHPRLLPIQVQWYRPIASNTAPMAAGTFPWQPTSLSTTAGSSRPAHVTTDGRSPMEPASVTAALDHLG